MGESVVRRTAIMWNIQTAVARTNERVAGINAPIRPPGASDNPLPISGYYVGAIFGFYCAQKVNASISALRVYGSLDPQRFPDPGDSSEALIVVNKDLTVGGGVIRYPVGSGAAGVDLSPRLLPPYLMLEYTVAGASIQVAVQVRATFIGSPPFGEEPEDFAG